jgi:hypothetical protein
MFFRRAAAIVPTFSSQLEGLRNAGFTVEPLPGGETKVTRDGIAAVLSPTSNEGFSPLRPGVTVGDEIAVLLDGGYQKFFQTPSGKRLPAQAAQLRAIHDFTEDLTVALGLSTHYNEALGTVSTLYQYDRVADRDRGAAKRVWEK